MTLRVLASTGSSAALLIGAGVIAIGSGGASGSAPSQAAVEPATIGPAWPGRPARAAAADHSASVDWLVDNYGAYRPDPTTAWLPDSRRLLVSQTTPNGTPRINVVDTRNGSTRRLATGSEPTLSPDGTRVAYRGSDGQVWVAPARGGETRRLTTLNRPPASFAWTPGGNAVAYATSRIIEPPPLSDTATVRDVTVAPRSMSTVYVKPLDGPRRTLVSKARGSVWTLLPVPKHRQLLMQTYYGYEGRSTEVNTHVDVVSLRDGATRRLLDDPGGQAFGMVPSPDGRSLAFQYARDPVAFPSFTDLGVVPISGGEPVRLTEDVYAWSTPAWSPDGALYVTCKEAVLVEACAAPSDVAEPGALDRLWPRRGGDVKGLSLSPDGTRLAWTFHTAYAGEELQVGRVDGGEPRGRPRTVATLRTPPNDVRLGEFREVSWQAPDGLPLHGLVVLPPGYQPGKRYPTVVDVHGGAEGGVRVDYGGTLLTNSPMEWQLWASLGYVVFAPDYRSGVISGWDAVVEAKDNYAELDGLDVISGTEAIIEAGIADPKRLALLGHSAGAMTNNFLLTQTDIYDAAVLHEGVAEWFFTPASGNAVMGSEINEWQFDGPPWEVGYEPYIRNSAAYHADQITTPTLLVSGSLAIGSDALAFSWKYLAGALIRQGVDAQYLDYEGEGHVFANPVNQKDWIRRALAWVRERVPPEGRAVPGMSSPPGSPNPYVDQGLRRRPGVVDGPQPDGVLARLQP